MHTPVDDLTLTIGQVAHMCGMSEPTFRKKRATLETLGFPRKLPGLTAYSRPAILAWFRSNGNQLSQPEIEPTIGVDIAEARSALEGEYAQ